MPTLIQSDVAKGLISMPYASLSGSVVSKRATVAVPATAAANDIFEMIPVPGGHRVVDVILDSDDLDTNGSPTITLDVGFMSGTPGDNDSARTVGTEFFSASTVAQAGGVARPTLKGALRDTPSDAERAIGIKVAAAGTTKAAGTVGLTVLLATD